MEHIISAHPILATAQYIKIHKRLRVQLHFNICEETGVKLDSEHWYDLLQKLAETSRENKVTILWNQEVRTVRTIPNKTDIIIRENKKGTCVFIDVAMSGDRNGFKKEAYNIIKIYRPYIINSAQVACESKSDPSNTRGNRNHLKVIQTIPEQHTGKSRNQRIIKKTAILAAHTTRKVLM